MVALGQWLKADRVVGGFRVGPRKVLVSVLAITSSFFLEVGRVLALGAAAVLDVVAHLRESPDVAGLAHDGQTKDVTDAGRGLQQLKFVP